MSRRLSYLHLGVLVFLFILIYFKGLFIFFTQDDFILIDYFSKADLLRDFKNVFAYPTVSHWRPIHNLYFLISGNLFKTSYFNYHLFCYLMHLATGLLIYKILKKIGFSSFISFASAFLYLIHIVHFNSLYWISGNSLNLGLLIFLASFYFLLRKQYNLSLLFYSLSLFANESMIMGSLILAFWELTFKRFSLKYFFSVLTVSLSFLLIKLLFLTPASTFDSYRVNILGAFRTVPYYMFRVLGFSETGEDFLESLLLSLILILAFYLSVKKSLAGKFHLVQKHLILPNKFGFPNWISVRRFLFRNKRILLPIVVFASGLVPFIFIPNHLSPNYMALSVFGFSILFSIALDKINSKSFYLLISFALVMLLNERALENNNWIVKKSIISKLYYEKVVQMNPASGETLIIGDTQISSSFDAYIASGGGIEFTLLFEHKNYKTCFTFFDKCEKGIYIY